MKSNGIVRQAADLLYRGFDQGPSRGNGLGIYGEQNKRR